MFFSKSIMAVAVAAITAATSVTAESHKVTFVNKCGKGTPTLVDQSGKTIATGNYTTTASLVGARAYLVDGAACKATGTGCTAVEMTLQNSISAADITLISPYKFQNPTSFIFTNGCAGTGATCKDASCCPTNAYCTPTDDAATRVCTAKDVGLEITFC